MDREIPEQYACILRTICGIDEAGEIPAKVQDAFWEFKRICDRIQEPVLHKDLAWLCYHKGYGKPFQREANPSVVTLWREKKIKADDPVLVQWRGGEKGAVLKRVTGSKVIVQLDGEADERTLTADKVRPAELASV